MIDFMCRFCVGKTPVLRRRLVVGAFAVSSFLLLLAFGAGARADAWDEFQKRCLVPMEQGGMPKTTGLHKTTIKSPYDDVEDYSGFVPVNGDWFMIAETRRCMFVEKSASQSVLQKAENWMEHVWKAGSYEPNHADSAVWYTTNRQRGVLQVVVDLNGSAWAETDVLFSTYERNADE